MGGAVHHRKMHTLGGLFEGGSDDMLDGGMSLGGVGLGGRSNKHNPLHGGAKKIEQLTSPWAIHVAEYRLNHPNVSYKEALKEAKGDYISVAYKGPKVSKTGKTRLSRAKSSHTYNITDVRALRALTDAELEMLPRFIEQMLPKKFKGAGAHVVHAIHQLHGAGILGKIIGHASQFLPW